VFPVPTLDHRLPNNAEVLTLRSREAPGESLAVSAAFLYRNPVWHGKLGAVEFVVLTDATGAQRVYETLGLNFVSWDRQFAAVDSQRKVWGVTEAALVSKDAPSLKRLPANRAFWFAWFAQYPNTRLVK
jgi:hypothetical protein